MSALSEDFIDGKRLSEITNNNFFYFVIYIPCICCREE